MSTWLWPDVIGLGNRQRTDAIQAERINLKPLPQRRTTDFTEIVVPVTRTGGFLVKSVFCEPRHHN